jgi:hypothetical protein
LAGSLSGTGSAGDPAGDGGVAGSGSAAAIETFNPSNNAIRILSMRASISFEDKCIVVEGHQNIKAISLRSM